MLVSASPLDYCPNIHSARTRGWEEIKSLNSSDFRAWTSDGRVSSGVSAFSGSSFATALVAKKKRARAPSFAKHFIGGNLRLYIFFFLYFLFSSSRLVRIILQELIYRIKPVGNKRRKRANW